MEGPARVQSVQALADLRLALLKFIAQAKSALADAEGELSRTTHWLAQEQRVHWQTQIVRRQEALLRAREALRQKKLFTTTLNTHPSTADEEKALLLAQRREEEARHKLLAVRQWTRKLDQEALLYHGQMQRLTGTLEHDLPQAVAELQRVMGTLDAYLALEAPSPPSAPDRGGAEPSGMGLAAERIEPPPAQRPGEEPSGPDKGPSP